MREADIQTAIMQHLGWRGRKDILFLKIPNDFWANGREWRRQAREGARAGAADVLLVIDGMPAFLELKTEKGRTRQTQDEFGAAATRAGAVYRVAYGLDQALAILNELGAFPHSEDRPRLGLGPLASAARSCSSPTDCADCGPCTVRTFTRNARKSRPRSGGLLEAGRAASPAS